MAHGPLWYFAYGSNMSPGTFLTRREMYPLEACPGVVAGHRLCFDIPIGPGERGVANLAVDRAASTYGVAYLITHGDADRLDRTEGVPTGIYFRAEVEVALLRGDRVHGFTYRSRHSDPRRRPSARYLDILLDGARHHRLPAEWVTRLECWELAFDERIGAVRPPERD